VFLDQSDQQAVM